MPNESGNAYALTVLSPIVNGYHGEISHASETERRLLDLDLDEKSPMAKVPQTYLARFFVLHDVYYENAPEAEDHLKSKYLVFSSNFHGGLEDYLRGMWNAIESDIRHIWEYCVAFDRVKDADGFIEYIKKCQLEANLFFNGSTDDSLEEQLKSLYLKQEFAKFAVEHQGWGAADLQQAFKEFIARAEPKNLAGPTWRPGQSTLS